LANTHTDTHHCTRTHGYQSAVSAGQLSFECEGDGAKASQSGGWLGGRGLMFWGWQQWVKGMGMAL